MGIIKHTVDTTFSEGRNDSMKIPDRLLRIPFRLMEQTPSPKCRHTHTTPDLHLQTHAYSRSLHADSCNIRFTPEMVLPFYRLLSHFLLFSPSTKKETSLLKQNIDPLRDRWQSRFHIFHKRQHQRLNCTMPFLLRKPLFPFAKTLFPLRNTLFPFMNAL